MSDLPPDEEEAGEVDALYRRMSAAEPTQPGEGVRLAVLAYATRRAAQAAAESGVVPKEYSWQRRRGVWGRPAAFGALAAGILAAFMLGPRYFGPPLAPPVTEERVAAAAPPAVSPPVAEEPGAAAPPPVFADLGSSSPARESPPPAMTVPPQPRSLDARQRVPSPAGAPVHDARVAEVATAAPPTPAPGARAETSDSLNADRAAGAPAKAATSAASAASVSSVATSAKQGDSAVLWQAAQDGDLAVLRDLHNRHADLNVTDSDGRTAVMLATLHGHAQAVAALLDYGADPNIPDARGESPLSVALAAEQGEIAGALRRHGAR